MLDDLKSFLLSSVGNMLNARIERTQDRLLLAKRLRPSLASDKREPSPSIQPGILNLTETRNPVTGRSALSSQPIPASQGVLEEEGPKWPTGRKK